MRTRKLFVPVVALVVSLSFTSTITAQQRYEGSTITGTAYFVGSRYATRSRSLSFRLIIDRFATAQEISDLNAVLQSGGQDALLRKLSELNSGRIQIGTGVGVKANVIMATEDEGRTKITVLYERYLGIGELRFGSRSQDYRFGYAEMYVGRGANEGMLIPAAKVRLRDGNTWEVEDFGTFPARLQGLQVRGGPGNVR